MSENAYLPERPRKNSSFVPFQMIFEALQSKLFRFNFHSLSSEILKIPEFSLFIIDFNSFSRRKIDSIYEPFPKFKGSICLNQSLNAIISSPITENLSAQMVSHDQSWKRFISMIQISWEKRFNFNFLIDKRF